MASRPLASRPLLPVGPSSEETTKRYPVVCTPEAYHGKGISSLKRSRLRISNASDAATNLRGPLGLRKLNLEAVGPPCSSCHQRAPEANGALIMWREGPTEVE